MQTSAMRRRKKGRKLARLAPKLGPIWRQRRQYTGTAGQAGVENVRLDELLRRGGLGQGRPRARRHELAGSDGDGQRLGLVVHGHGRRRPHAAKRQCSDGTVHIIKRNTGAVLLLLVVNRQPPQPAVVQMEIGRRRARRLLRAKCRRGTRRLGRAAADGAKDIFHDRRGRRRR